MVYTDPQVTAAAATGCIAKELRHRLIRGTIHNMTSASSCAPFNRLPSCSEIEEMAKSLVVAYPCLKDEETGHGVMFKQLRRRLSNIKQVKKPQGPCPKKRRITVSSETSSSECSPQSISANTDSGSDSISSECLTQEASIMERHYAALEKEMCKSKPNVDVINCYLNKEYPSRRMWLRKTSAEERCGSLLLKYPCFKDPVEIIEEARRVTNSPFQTRSSFMEVTLGRFKAELESLIYFSLHKGLSPPKSFKPSEKVKYIFRNLSILFPGKAKIGGRKVIDIVHELKNHEDPNTWSGRQNGNIPVMLYDSETVYVVVGNKILFNLNESKVMLAAVAYVATFYLLDFDYPKVVEMGMNIIQQEVFNDDNVPLDISAAFVSTYKAYRKYKQENCCSTL